jgi:starch synthase
VNILLAASELTPLTRSGDLADFCRALPLELAKLGHSAAVILPAYRDARVRSQASPLPRGELSIAVGNKTVAGRLLRGAPLDGAVPVYLVEQNQYFDRPGLYQSNGQDYIDNCERFVFFCRAVMEAIPLLRPRIDVLHANDWQTGLLPAYLHAEYRGVPGYEQIASVFTVHNAAFQGQFWHWDMMLTGLDWKYFNWQQMEFFGNLSLLKTALVFADALTTVSPAYALEIQTPPQTLEPNESGLLRHVELPRGCGLEGVLSARRDLLTGILSGVDDEPRELLHDGYTATSDMEAPAAKAQNKRSLLRELGLPHSPDMPLAAVVGPLSEQHGFDLVLAVLQNWLTQHDLRWIVVGEAGRMYRDIATDLARRYPAKLAVRLEADEALVRRVLSGAELLVSASRFGPGGTLHLRGMKHGTIPVAYQAGIAADTIVDATAEQVTKGDASGFLFPKYSTAALHTALARACAAYRQPKDWAKLIAAAQRSPRKWRDTAERYLEVYERAAKRLKQRAAT